ncbi:type I restriction-modification system subunit M N-terminal domain-containing protein [Streptomyces enissocaesilis]|uniref:type I restriction-modification system subunit M N-terminal domain-containing protein n=1 Tax=Streptomyces enissocaesilis TaxID=332589 RepID=UPI003CD061C8
MGRWLLARAKRSALLVDSREELVSALGSFVWSIADRLRGPCRPNQYGTVVLPFTIVRRLDCILEPDHAMVRPRSSTTAIPTWRCSRSSCACWRK